MYILQISGQREPVSLDMASSNSPRIRLLRPFSGRMDNATSGLQDLSSQQNGISEGTETDNFFFFSLIPHSSIYQLLPLLFSDNGKKAWHHTAVVPCYRMEKAAGTTSTVVPILHLEHRSRDGKHI